MFTGAITRQPGPELVQALTTADLGAPDAQLGSSQHSSYVSVLEKCGLIVQVLDPLPGFADACFVEDTAVVLPEIGVICRPGAASRRGETASIAEALSPRRELVSLDPEGTLDGGDVLVVDNRVYVGISARTNRRGACQLLDILAAYGYQGETIPLAGGLHLKSSVNTLGNNTLIATPGFADHSAFSRHRVLIGPAEEAYACNTLWVNDRLLTPAGFPRTMELLQGLELELEIIEIEMSEFQKADGGLTCLSLRF